MGIVLVSATPPGAGYGQDEPGNSPDPLARGGSIQLPLATSRNVWNSCCSMRSLTLLIRIIGIYSGCSRNASSFARSRKDLSFSIAEVKFQAPIHPSRRAETISRPEALRAGNKAASQQAASTPPACRSTCQRPSLSESAPDSGKK